MQKLYTLPKRNYKWYFVRNCSKKVHESIHAFSTLQAKSQLIGFKYDIVSEGTSLSKLILKSNTASYQYSKAYF